MGFGIKVGKWDSQRPTKNTGIPGVDNAARNIGRHYQGLIDDVTDVARAANVRADASRPLNTLADIATSPYRATAAIYTKAYDAGREPVTTSLGGKSDAEIAAGKEEQRKAQAQAERSRIFREAATVDSLSRGEIYSILENGNPADAARILADAKKGTGIYAVRAINEAQRNLLNLRPGRAQLSSRYSIIS